MGLLDAFNETWSQARETFGQGTPEDGSKFDGSSRLLQMKSSVEAAAPDSRWQGTASDAYAVASTDADECDRKLLPIVNKGVSQLSEIIQKSTNDMTDIRGRVQGIKREYEGLIRQKFGAAS